MKKAIVVILILVILLVASVGYIVYGFYSNWDYKKQANAYQRGAQYGFEQAIVQISGMAVSCQQVPLTVQNQTINIVSVDCLQKSQPQ